MHATLSDHTLSGGVIHRVAARLVQTVSPPAHAIDSWRACCHVMCMRMGHYAAASARGQWLIWKLHVTLRAGSSGV